METRRLKIDEYEEIVKLWVKAGLPFKPRGRDSRSSVVTEMKANPDFFLGAFDGNQLVGTVILSCDLRRGWINRLAVDPAYRQQGIAKAMIVESEKILGRKGIRLFCALIDNDNVASKKLFKKCGYVGHRDITYFSKREDDDV